MTSTRGLRIFLLGRFQIHVDGVPIEEQRWPRKKAKVLMKLLALAPRHEMHREQLTELLWPELESNFALNNLHKVMYSARRALEPNLAQGTSRFLAMQDNVVRMIPEELWIDADDFERKATEALRSGATKALETALELYCGDLLEEDRYEDWASLQRERLRILYQRTLERLAKNYESEGDQRALDGFSRLLAINPANEDAHRRLMTIYAARGQRHLAAEQFRICREALKRELDAEPEEATVRLHERLMAGEGKLDTAMRVGAAQTAAAIPVNLRRRRIVVMAASTASIAAAVAVLGKGRLNSISQGPVDRVQSLAVLPLRAEGGKELESVADGMTEEFINSLSRLPGIRVMARGTVFTYKGRSDARAVGRELKVSTVLFGYFRQREELASAGVELIDVADGARLWARQYSVPKDNVSSLQRLLVSDLETALRAGLDGQGKKDKPRLSTANPEAYRLYLLGRSFWNQRTPAGFRKSIEYYRRAIDLDAGYALAYVGLADSYGLLGWDEGLPRDYFPKARDAANRALELDASLAEAQTSLAMVSALYDWNWAAAEAQFGRAIELNAGYATAHHWYGVHLCAMGRFPDAERELAVALDLDPLSAALNVNRGYPSLYRRQVEGAILAFNKARELNPGYAAVHKDLMTAYILRGDRAAAANHAIQFLRLSEQPELAEAAERANREGGFAAALRFWLEFAEKRAEDDLASPMLPAQLAARLGERDRAFAWLEKSLKRRCPQLVYLAVDPQYDSLRGDRRFRTVLEGVGLPGR